MTARAEAMQETADRILAATEEVFWQRPAESVSLDAVARRAGVSKQTVLRRFGSKAALLEAGAARALARVDEERGSLTPGDLRGAIRLLVDHYERAGDGVLRLLAEETRNPRLRKFAEPGRAYHADWCERVFAPTLECLEGAQRQRRLAQLVAITDVYTWKLLRRDRGLGRAATETAIRELAEALTGGPR